MLCTYSHAMIRKPTPDSARVLCNPDCPQKSKVLPGTRHSAPVNHGRLYANLGPSSARDHLSLPVDSQSANEISSVPEHTDPLHRWRIQGVPAYRTIAPSHADAPDDSTAFSNLSADTKAKEAASAQPMYEVTPPGTLALTMPNCISGHSFRPVLRVSPLRPTEYEQTSLLLFSTRLRSLSSSSFCPAKRCSHLHFHALHFTQ